MLNTADISGSIVQGTIFIHFTKSRTILTEIVCIILSAYQTCFYSSLDKNLCRKKFILNDRMELPWICLNILINFILQVVNLDTRADRSLFKNLDDSFKGIFIISNIALLCITLHRNIHPTEVFLCLCTLRDNYKLISCLWSILQFLHRCCNIILIGK